MACTIPRIHETDYEKEKKTAVSLNSAQSSCVQCFPGIRVGKCHNVPYVISNGKSEIRFITCCI